MEIFPLTMEISSHGLISIALPIGHMAAECRRPELSKIPQRFLLGSENQELPMPTSRVSPLATVAAEPVSPSRLARTGACLLFCSLVFCSLALGPTPAPAEELTVEQMICALDPQCGKPFEDVRLRGVTATPSMHTPGSFDRTVNFAFNSAELTADARKELDAVAEALNSSNLSKLDIVIAGHTDAVGNDDYNQALSQKRADAARQYLITQNGIDGKRLTAKGYGKSQLLLPADPTNELNRRVQFINPNYNISSAPGASAPTARPASSSDGL